METVIRIINDGVLLLAILVLAICLIWHFGLNKMSSLRYWQMATIAVAIIFLVNIVSIVLDVVYYNGIGIIILHAILALIVLGLTKIGICEINEETRRIKYLKEVLGEKKD